MKLQSKQFTLLLAIIMGLHACGKKETAPAGDESQVKTFTSEAQLRHALGSFVTGYDRPLNLFGEDGGNQQFYMSWSPKETEGKPYNYYRAVQLWRYEDERSREEVIGRNSFYVVVEDPRLNNPLYSNVVIITSGNNRKSGWSYILYVLHRGLSNITEEAHLTGGFGFVAGAAGEAEWFAQAPEPPTDKEAVTALLNLLEPVVGD